MLEQYKNLWSEIKKQVKKIDNSKSIKYGDDFMKIKVDSRDNLPLNKILHILVLDMIVESVSQIENEYYPRIYISECEYDTYKNIKNRTCYFYNDLINLN